MATPRKPATATELKAAVRNRKPATASEWRKKNEDANAFIVELPSGIDVKIKRPGMEAFLSAGLLPDTMAAEIKRQMELAKGKPPSQVDKVMDKEQIAALLESSEIVEIMEAMNRVMAHCIVEPKVAWHMREVVDEDGQIIWEDDKHTRPLTEYIPEDERDEDVVYTDEIDQEDKNFVFQFAVGGSSDLTRFRQESEAVVEALADGEDLADTAKRTTGNRQTRRASTRGQRR